jgi:UDP-N-acetylmuramate--alanine ligase
MHIYFSGLGGVAIGPLALICRDAGYSVSGSDLHESRWTKLIEKEGIPVALGQDGTHIAKMHATNPIDWLVISAAVPADHPEVAFAREHGIKITKRADMINRVIEDKKLKLLAISGTHGKTTTTAMLAWLFMHYEKPVSYSVGSHMSFGPSGAYQPESQYFVYECDEFDRNMLEFHPFTSLITSVDYDHPDVYPTRADYDNAFRQFATQSQHLYAWQADVDRLQLTHSHLSILREKDPHIAQIQLAGLHNRQNAWQAITAFCALFPDIPLAEVVVQIGNFPGTDRRFEKLAENIYTTYAHHPTEIMADLQLARELNQDVVAVYQPHQNVRQHEIINEYQNCFEGARRVYWLPTYLSREDPTLPVLSPEELIVHLTDPAVAKVAEMDDTLVQHVRQATARGALVVFMGAGTIDEWARQHFSTTES